MKIAKKEIEATARLQALSLEIIGAQDVSVLYDKIVDAAAIIMRSQFASMQMLHPERGRGGELRLLAFRGFDPAAARFWEWVRADSNCTCGMALRTRGRVIAADVEQAAFMAGSEDQRMLLATGIRAAQTTPLVSRDGSVLGMISTHWDHPYQPTEAQLRLFDILARQAADLIERRQVEEALHQNRERVQRLLTLMPAAVYTVSAPSGVIDYYNDQAARLWGRSPARGDNDERFCGSYRLWRLDGSPLPHDRTPMALAMRKGESFRNQEVVIERPDGSRVTVLVNIDPLRDAEGRVTGAINVFHDITERRRIDEALQASEERYKAIVESQTEMVCRFRPDGTILFANAAYALSRGTSVEALTGRNFWEHIPREDHDGVKRLLERMTPASPEVTIENRFETVEGARWTLWKNRALAFDAQGRVAEAQSTGIDITDRKRAEEALRDADRRKDEFIAILSHELRNPLAPISNALTLLHQADDDASIRHQARAVLDRQVRHLIRLVEDLLDVSRIGRGDVALEKRPVRVAEIVASAVETSRPRIESGGHSLRVRQSDPDISVVGDPVRLAQVLANLLNNAAAYTPHGGRIEVEVSARAGHAVVAVRDSGVGMTAGELAVLFSMFSRGDVARQNPSGFGIGLALARRLVEMHGGTIEAASAGPGQGAEFTVRLPLAPILEEPASASQGPAATPAAPKRILVVDDNRDAADSLGLVLRSLGAEVHVAHDGPAALAEFDAHVPSVVLLDIGMPGMSGYEVARQIRSRAAGRRAALVALTGWGQEDDRRRAREAGFDHHLVKPAEIETLQALIASLR